MTVGPDGMIWFTEWAGNRIGRISVTGAITEFDIPSSHSYPEGIAVTEDGIVWFTETNRNQIGRLTPDGTVREMAIPTPRSDAEGMASEGTTVWFTERVGGNIGQIGPGSALEEHPVAGDPVGIAVGPGGAALWFTDTFDEGAIVLAQP